MDRRGDEEPEKEKGGRVTDKDTKAEERKAAAAEKRMKGNVRERGNGRLGGTEQEKVGGKGGGICPYLRRASSGANVQVKACGSQIPPNPNNGHIRADII